MRIQWLVVFFMSLGCIDRSLSGIWKLSSDDSRILGGMNYPLWENTVDFPDSLRASYKFKRVLHKVRYQGAIACMVEGRVRTPILSDGYVRWGRTMKRILSGLSSFKTYWHASSMLSNLDSAEPAGTRTLFSCLMPERIVFKLAEVTRVPVKQQSFSDFSLKMPVVRRRSLFEAFHCTMSIIFVGLPT